jgi:AGZA family xanthine/uracil permease-like MFS transporter
MITEFYRLDERGTSIGREFTAGATTFATMVYIVVVNPKILEAAGIPFGASMAATILTAVFGTLVMGVYANRPFAVAPYMGENAFIAYTVVKVLGYSWETALGAIFIGGVLFTIITVLGIRGWLSRAIPEALKIAFAVGIGLFIAFIGLNTTGIVKIGVPGAPVHVGNFHDPAVLLAIFGFLLICFLMIRGVKAALILGITAVSFLAFLLGVTPSPSEWVSLPPSLAPTFLRLNILGALSWGFFAVVLTVLVTDFVDTLGTLIGLAYRADLLDETGNLPDIKKPMLADSLSTVVASLLGTTTAGVYIESATGIEAGGRTGLTSVFTALLFALTLFLAPFLTAVPTCAYGPALIIVGMLMLAPLAKLKTEDLTEIVPVFAVITLMSFTYNLGIGITAGFVIYPVVKIFAGRREEIHPGMWILGAMSLAFFIYYPY